MKNQNSRTWKSQDYQSLPPLSWCRICGRELYPGMIQDGFCPNCRPKPTEKEAQP